MAIVAQLVRASRCGREGCRFESGQSPTMLGFLNTRISTLAGIIVLLLICLGIGFAIVYQMNQIVSIRVNAIEAIE